MISERKPEMSALSYIAESDKLSTQQAQVATSTATEFVVLGTTEPAPRLQSGRSLAEFLI
jgi:hypothetical protein